MYDDSEYEANDDIGGDNEVELTDEESFDDRDDVAKVFRIDTNIFDYETPLGSTFKEFNYLLEVDPDLLTKRYYSWKDDGYCNGGNLPGTYIIENQLHYQDYKWYEALEDSELKKEALRNKVIMEGSIKEDNDESLGFVPEELLPPKKRICSPSSSSTTLPNPSRNQTCDLISPSSSVYTPTPPQIFEIGKCSVKMHLKHHEKQVEDILNYLDELSFHRIEKMEEGRIDRMIIRRNSDELKIELERIRTQIIKLQRKKLGQKDKIAFAHYRISDLEQIIEKIQARHQTDQEDL
ncbi:hypothetical protein Tco_1256855 [Tanacetum coccineum]